MPRPVPAVPRPTPGVSPAPAVSPVRSTSPAPRLLDAVRLACRARCYSPRTEEADTGWVRRYVRFHGRRHPRELGERDLARFLSALTERRGCSASTQNQAYSALHFLYREVLGIRLEPIEGVARARRPKHLPVVLTRTEVRQVLGQLSGPSRLVALLLYGSGLRLLEALQLRVKDVDLARQQITVRGGKGTGTA